MPKVTYDPGTGALLKDGKPCGTKNPGGYLVLRYEGKVVYAHRLAWFLTHGQWPSLVDHINGDRADNRLENLREVTASENAQNMTGRRAGAHLHKNSGLYRTSVRVDGRSVHLGYFKTADEAQNAYAAAKKQFHSTWRST